MIVMNSFQEFVTKLCKLTDEDEIKWERPVLNIHHAVWNGWNFYTEMPQDEQPVLEIKNPGGKPLRVQGYSYGIEKLNGCIYDQHKRLKLYEFSVAAQINRGLEAARRATQNYTRVILMGQLLEEFNRATGK